MTELVVEFRSKTIGFLNYFWTKEKVWCVSLGILAVLLFVSPELSVTTVGFVIQNLLNVGPFLLLSIGIAAYANATGADGLIARVFTGSPSTMILLAAIVGGFSPFCSCGVIPLIAALLVMGVPLSAVMAFWLASPVMDPSMFFLTTGVLGIEFAIGKTLAALALGIVGGYTVHLLSSAGALADPLREGVGNGGCGGSKVRTVQPVVWKFWREDERTKKFGREGLKTTLFLAKWLTLAFILESLMLAWVPAELVSQSLGGTGVVPIAVATVVGVPAYFNGYAALPLVSGLIDQGMAPGAGMAFLVAGGVSSLPAAIAVWALVRKEVFFIYLGVALTGSFTIGLAFQFWVEI